MYKSNLILYKKDDTLVQSNTDLQEPEVSYFYIEVETDSEYKHIRMDQWNTPVQTNDHFNCTRFETYEEALEVIDKFNLVSTSYVHKIRLARATGTHVWDNVVYAYCSLKKLKNGKFGLDVSKRM